MARLDYPAGTIGDEGVENASFFTRWMWVYFSPRKAFTAVARRPMWVIPFVLLIVLSTLVAYFTAPINQEYMKHRIEQSERIPEDRKDEIIQDMEGGTGHSREMMRAGGTILFVAVLLLGLGGVFLLINNLIMGGSARYSQTLGAAAYTCLLWVPSWIVKVPLMFAQHAIQVSMGPAALLPPESEGSLMWAALSRIDIFGIWHILLACIALSCIGGYSAKRASAAVIPLWIVYSVALTFITWFGFKQLG